MVYSISIKNQAAALRQKGFSLNEISSNLNISKTTVHDWVSDKIILSEKAQARIAKRISDGIAKANYAKYEGKYKGIYSKIVPKPRSWSNNLVSIVAHFMFDGGRQNDSYVYYNSSTGLVREVSEKVEEIFKLTPKRRLTPEGVIRAIFFSMDFVRYLDRKIPYLIKYIPSARKEEKRAFLQAFFNDEGNAFYDKKYGHNRVRGYQKNTDILLIVKKLLREFEIESRIEKNEIVISRKHDFKNFKKEINFSPYLFLNPKRKNSIWKRKISKRELLDMIICPSVNQS